MSYGIDNIDVLKKAALYVHRILNGAKPVDLPVQAPTKFETVINLKTANALRLIVPFFVTRYRRRGDRMKDATLSG